MILNVYIFTVSRPVVTCNLISVCDFLFLIFVFFFFVLGSWPYSSTMNTLSCHAKSIGSGGDNGVTDSDYFLNLLNQMRRSRNDEYPEVVSVKIPPPSLLESIEMPNAAEIKKIGTLQKLLPGVSPCLVCFWNEVLWVF